MNEDAKDARREYSRRYREKNREHIREYNRKYQRKWRATNPEKCRGYLVTYWTKKAAETEIRNKETLNMLAEIKKLNKEI